MLKNMRTHKIYPLVLLILLGFTWGTSFAIARYVFQNSSITPLGYLFWQTIGPAVLIWTVISIYKQSVQKYSIKNTQFFLSSSILGIILPNFFMYKSAPLVASGLLGLIVNTTPIFTYLFSLMFKIERFYFRRAFGIISGFLGIFLLFIGHVDFSMHIHFLPFLVPIMFSLCTLFIFKFRPKNITSSELTWGMLVTASIFILPIVLLKGSFYSIFQINFVNTLILFEIFLATCGYVLYFELLRVASPVYYCLVSCIVALSGVYWGYVVFQEKLTPTAFVLILTTIFSIFLVGKPIVKK